MEVDLENSPPTIFGSIARQKTATGYEHLIALAAEAEVFSKTGMRQSF